MLPVIARATPSLTLVAMLKALLKFTAGVKVRPASKVFTFASTPLAVQTPAVNVEVTVPAVAVFKLPAATFDRVKIAVTVGLSTSLITMSIRFNAVFWV